MRIEMSKNTLQGLKDLCMLKTKKKKRKATNFEIIGDYVIKCLGWHNIFKLKNRCRRSKSTNCNMKVFEPHPSS